MGDAAKGPAVTLGARSLPGNCFEAVGLDPPMGGISARRRFSLQAAFSCFAATAAAAFRITSSTARGWESIGT
jgi:hypothetical protein